MDNTPPTPIPVEPINGQGLSVHMSYIRRDMDELKQSQAKWHTDLMTRLDEIQSLYPTRKEFEEIIKMTDDHETRMRAIEKTMWKWLGIASVIGVVASVIMQIFLKVT